MTTTEDQSIFFQSRMESICENNKKSEIVELIEQHVNKNPAAIACIFAPVPLIGL
jgi:hypothetical protein